MNHALEFRKSMQENKCVSYVRKQRCCIEEFEDSQILTNSNINAGKENYQYVFCTYLGSVDYAMQIGMILNINVMFGNFF